MSSACADVRNSICMNLLSIVIAQELAWVIEDLRGLTKCQGVGGHVVKVSDEGCTLGRCGREEIADPVHCLDICRLIHDGAVLAVQRI